MKPKSKLILNAICFVAIACLMVWCLVKGNLFGATIDILLLGYYSLMMKWAYEDMKRER